MGEREQRRGGSRGEEGGREGGREEGRREEGRRREGGKREEERVLKIAIATFHSKYYITMIFKLEFYTTICCTYMQNSTHNITLKFNFHQYFQLYSTLMSVNVMHIPFRHQLCQ